MIIGTIPLLSDVVTKVKIKNTKSKELKSSTANGDAIDIENDNGDLIVQVTVTDEAGNVVEDTDKLDDEMDCLLAAKKRVRMPSSILSELYPSLPSPYYR